MRGSDWLDELGRRVGQRLQDVEQCRLDEDTLTLALGTRGLTAHDAGDAVWLSPSFSTGGTIGGRLQDHVQHLEITRCGIDDATIDVAVDAILSHLCS